MVDKEWLLELANDLDVKLDSPEEPEGIHWIQISHKLARKMAQRLRAIAEKIDDRVNARCVCPLCGQGHDPKLIGDGGGGKDG